MVNVPGSIVQPLLTCLEDGSSPPEDKTDAYLRLAEDLAKEDKQFVEEVCNFSARLLSVLTRDMLSQRIDLSQAALQAVGYCIYQDRIVSSLPEAEMLMIIQDLCNVVMNSTDKNLCTRALWGIAKQHLSANVIIEKLPVVLNTVEYALQTFESPTVENEALEVVYRLISELPSGSIVATAGQWSKLVYPLLISSAHKIREKALGVLELGLKLILLAREDVVAQLSLDLKGGLLSELAKLFSDKKEVFVLRTWTVLVTILGETLHKGGNLINDLLKIPEQGFKSSLSNVQNMSYSAWVCLIDNFAISPAFLGSQKKIKLLMMPLLLHSGKVIHKDIELGRLQAWWHLVCAIKPEIYTKTTTFTEVCLPLLQYYFNVSIDPTTTPSSRLKDGLRELTLPVTPVARGHASPASSKSVRNTPKRKSATFNKGKFPEAFVKQILLIGCEMLMEILASNTNEVRNNKRLTEHLQNPILNITLLQEHLPFFLAFVKSALRSCGSYLEDDVAISIWNNMVNWIVSLLCNGDPKSIDDVIASLFLTANDVLTCSCLSPSVVLKLLELLCKIPVKYLLHSVDILSSTCCQGKPLFLLADILFSQLSAFKESYVDERFHIVFENLIDIGFEAPSGKLTTVHNIWLVLEGLASTVANVEDLWRFWSKVTDSVSECVTKTSDVNQGDSLEPNFSFMISLLSFPFKQLFTGGLPVATTKELDRDLAEFFRLFCRCASLVATAEANTCVEQLSKPLITVVTQEKCKNVRFLDSISGFIYVMMDCFDFSTQNALPTSSSRGNLTSGGKSRHAETPLGNLSSLVALSAKVLAISYRVDKDSSGSMMVAPAVTALAGSLSKLFTSLTNAQHITFSIGALSSSVSSFISHHKWSSSNAKFDGRSSDKKYNSKFLLKIEKLWTDILMCLQSRYTAAYDSQLLEIMSELLECTFCHNRRQFKNQTIMFWNATFGLASHLEYPDSLRVCLQTVLERTPLTVPSWDPSKDQAKVALLDRPATLQDSEEMTPKENIIKQDVVIANSPKRKHSGSSPGKLKGSFLHKAFSSDKTDRLSPVKKNLETGNKRKSPGSANARRKLPLPLDTTDDTEFVVIAPSPKKKRFLTEHQKEVRKAKKIESGHPALYNMLDQSQDGTQFSQWSQASMTQSLLHHDVEMPEEKNAPSGDSMETQNDDEMSKLKSSIQASITILLDNNSEEFDGLPNDMIGGLSNNENGETESSHDNIGITPELQTLPGSSESKRLNNLDNDDDDDDPIPSSQTTSTSSTQNRRSYIHRQSRTPRSMKQSLSREKSETVEAMNADVDKMKPVIENFVNAPLPTDLVWKSLTHEEANKTSSSELIDTVESGSSEALLKTKKKKSAKTSPISSRTRLRKKPTPIKTKQNKPLKNIESFLAAAAEQKPDEPSKPEFVISDVEVFSDHQMDDTQILQESSVQVSMSSNNEVNETVNKILNDAPSSPVAMKFVHSKNSTTGSPLNRPTRSFSSPACSPTTGILKRNRGKSETPSPPGRTRHVSFAFPLKEEKEISFYPLDQVLIDVQNNQKERKTQAEISNGFTSIKSTPTKSLTSPLSEEECVFPDLVECTTPVEQILPSLATSRWSRGLGHVVHAQNIRTVGNLSALTKDQVEKLPIRSPKVSTLRRVLRSFHQNRVPKSSKVIQLRAIKEVFEEAETEMETEGDIVNGLPELVDNETKCIAGNTEELTCTNTPDLCDKEPMAVGTPSTSASTADSRKMRTPKRSRALVKPTTLFESDTDIEKVVESKTVKLAADELSDDVESLEESAIIFTDEKQKYTSECYMDEEAKENEIPCETTADIVEKMTEDKIPSALRENVDIEVAPESEHTFEPSAKMDVQEADYEIPVEDVPETEEPQQENQEMLVENMETTKESKQENQEMPVEDVAETEEQQQESPEMVVENVFKTEESKQENQEMPVEDIAETEEQQQESPEMVVENAYKTEESKQENQEMPVEDVPETEEQQQESPEMVVENAHKTEESKQENQELPVQDAPETEEQQQENLEMVVVNAHTTEESKQENPEMPVEDMHTFEELEDESQETPVEDVPKTEEAKQENEQMASTDIVQVEDTIEPYVKAIHDLLTLKSQQELNELPLNLLFSCQDQLMTILSNTTTAIRLKCEESRK